MISLSPDPIFLSLQGEGLYAGVPMVFVRTAGCSVGCPECDTDYSVDSRATLGEILDRIMEVRGASKIVWVTGGEPTDQPELQDLAMGIRGAGMRPFIATSGKRSVPVGFDFISVSYHGGYELKQVWGHEFKAVPGLNGLTLQDIDRLDLKLFNEKFLQPLWGSSKSREECVQYALTNPGWRVTEQLHKTWLLP